MPHRHLTRRPCVLIVDDSAPNRELLRSILENDYTIIEAADGHEAIAAAARADVDLVLLDVMMPGLTGYDVSRALRESRPNEFLPILLLTSLTESAERIAGFDAGADDFISKPINTQELRVRVRAFLRTRRLHLEHQVLLHDLNHLHALKDDLTALLVHDLRNPLSGLVANLGLLQLEPLGAEAADALAGAHAAADRLRAMIDDLLQVRLLEDGAQVAQRAPVELTAIAHAVVAASEAAASARDLMIAVDAPAEVEILGDETLFRRALENLIANAIRHATAGTRVVIGIRAESATVRVSVQDEGPGIPQAQRPLLFTKYGSGELRRGGQRSGHGLGLYLVSLVMREHDGHVAVDDSFTGGTRVVMTLPRASRAVDAVA